MRWRLMAVAAAALGAAALSGCGGSSTKTHEAAPGVASISRAPVASASAAADGSAGVHGPQVRLDTTKAERQSWNLAYYHCMVDHGAPETQPQKASEGGYISPTPPPAAAAACARLKPINVPPEMNPDLNPDYKQQWHEDVKCLQRRGMPIVETEDGWTFKSSDAVLPPNEEQIEHECDIEAFSKK